MKRIYKQWFNYWYINMKKSTLILLLCPIFLNGCMITWPIVDDLDHYQKWDTYESIRNNNEKEIIEENIQESSADEEDSKAIERCVNSRNNDPTLYEDESIIAQHNQFENTEDFCTEFVKTNPMFYNDIIWINESWEQIWQDWEIIEN